MRSSCSASCRPAEPTRCHANAKSRAALTFLLLLVGCNTAIETKTGDNSQSAGLKNADGGSSSSNSVDRVTAGPPLKKTLQLFTEQPARVEPFEETAIHSKIAGYVQSILCDIGDRVAKGQLLLQIHAPEYHDQLLQKRGMLEQVQAEAKQAVAALAVAEAAEKSAESLVVHAQAGISRAQADFVRWESELQRIEQLVSKGSIASKLVDETSSKLASADAARKESLAHAESTQAKQAEARASVSKASADVEAVKARISVAQAEVTLAETMLSYTQLTAPFDGVITSRQADSGYYVQPSGANAPLLTIANIDKVKVHVNIPESDAIWLDADSDKTPTGDPVSIIAPRLPEGKVDSRVTRTNRKLDSQSRTLSAEVDLENANHQLIVGAFVTAKILLEKRENVLVLPISAVVKSNEGTRCCLVEDGKISMRVIELGLRVGDEVEVKSGLVGNETVVQLRAGGLQAGQPVQVIAKK